MALIQCRECGKDVSSEAKTCPHCGIINNTAPAMVIPYGAVECKNCGYVGAPSRVSWDFGGCLIGIILLCCFLVPGIIYLIYRDGLAASECCSRCGGTNIVKSGAVGTSSPTIQVNSNPTSPWVWVMIVFVVCAIYGPGIFSMATKTAPVQPTPPKQVSQAPKPTMPPAEMEKKSREYKANLLAKRAAEEQKTKNFYDALQSVQGIGTLISGLKYKGDMPILIVTRGFLNGSYRDRLTLAKSMEKLVQFHLGNVGFSLQDQFGEEVGGKTSFSSLWVAEK